MADRRVSVAVDADVSPFVRGLTTASTSAKAFARELESADSRLANLVQTGLALAPALVPMGAAVVPAIAGLTTQLGFAVVAAGTTALAFNGVGDALDALNKFQLEPTQENFDKLRQELDRLGPAGQEFVLALQEMRPQVQRLQDIAQQGLLPGVTDGLNELLELMPQAEALIGTVSTTLGDLVAEAGDNLNDPRWVEFFDYLSVTAAPILSDMGRTFGNFVEGFAELTMAFDPLTQSFSDGMLEMSRSFADWAAGLDQTQGFQEFVAYVREAGPAALDTLVALGDAFLEFVEAAAPVGQVVLPVIEAVANTFGAIADSPIGPALIGAAAAIGTLGRSLAVLEAMGLRGDKKGGIVAKAIGAEQLKTIPGSLRAVTTATAELQTAQTALAASATKARDAQFALTPTSEKRKALAEYGAAQKKVADATEKVAAAERERRSALRAGAVQLGKSAALVGGLALATTGLADKTGLSNTMSLALMGTIAGPWGAAIGGGIGLVMDLAAANDDLQAASSRAEAAFASQTLSIQTQHSELANLRNELATYKETLGDASPFGDAGFFERLKGNWTQLSDSMTNTREEQEKLVHQHAEDLKLMRRGLAQVFSDASGGDMSLFNATNEELDEFATQVAPAASAAGLNLKQALLHGDWDAIADAVRDYTAEMDSASGKSRAVGEALRALAGEIEPAVTEAEALKSALDALFGVELNQAEATDAWTQSLKDLRKQLADAGTTITGNSQKALDNRAAIRQNVQALQDKVAADAAAGVSGAKLVRTLQHGRKAIIDQAVAAGVKKKDIKAYIDTLGLTPKNLTTIIETPGLLNAMQKVEALGKLYGLTPKQIKTLIAQPGMGTSQAEIKKLMRDYGLTPKQVKTFLKAIDQASGTLAAHRAAIARIPRNVVTTVRVTRIRGQEIVPGVATGGYITGPGGPTDDMIDARLSNGEYVVRAAAVDKYGIAMFDRLNAMAFARGGPVGEPHHFAGGGSVDRAEILRLRQEIRDLLKELAEGGKDALKGLERRRAQADLADARRELRETRRAPLVERREGLRGAIGGLDLASLVGRGDPRNPTVAEARREFTEFRRAIKDAGGEWTKALERQRDKVIRNARAYDRQQRAIEREIEVRDRLSQAVDEQRQALDALKQQMAQFGAEVAGNFLGSPFGQSRTVTVPGRVDPGLSRRLQEAEARLTGIRSSANPAALSAEASRLIPQIAAMRAEVERQSQPIERTISGWELMREQLKQNTADALAFTGALKELRADGLAPGLFAELARSGDLATALDLVAGGDAAVAEANQLWRERAEAAAELEALATDTVFGERLYLQQAALDRQVSLLEASAAREERMIAAQNRAADRIVAAQGAMVSRLEKEMAGLRAEIKDQPRQHRDNQRAGRGRA